MKTEKEEAKLDAMLAWRILRVKNKMRRHREVAAEARREVAELDSKIRLLEDKTSGGLD